MIRETILDNAVTVLETITRANGYNNDVGSVQRRPINEFKLAPKDYPALGVLWKREDKDVQGLPYDYVQNDLTMTVRGIIQASEDIEGELNGFIDDVEKALVADPTRGSVAEFTEPRGIVVFMGEREDLLYFDFDFAVRYFYVWGNP